MDTNTQVIMRFFDFYGLREVIGSKSSPEIMQFYKDSGHSWVSDDVTPWCSAMMNSVMKSLGLPITKDLAAQSWLKWGKTTQQPKKGDVVIFWRNTPTSGEGHVAIYIRETSEGIWCLGGNQGDMVNISCYPKSQLLGYRTMRDVSGEVVSKQKPFTFDITQTLFQGMKGSQVKTLQNLLKAFRNDLIGIVDGDFGPKTNTAVKAFQKAYGLTADGVVGSGTINKLRAFYSTL